MFVEYFKCIRVLDGLTKLLGDHNAPAWRSHAINASPIRNRQFEPKGNVTRLEKIDCIQVLLNGLMYVCGRHQGRVCSQFRAKHLHDPRNYFVNMRRTYIAEPYTKRQRKRRAYAFHTQENL